MKTPIFLLAGACLALMSGHVMAKSPEPLRANSLVIVADDFVVDAYHNGQRIPDSRRQLLLDRFGATVERITVQVRKGDWLVSNVVNNRLRWGGAYYFAVAGCLKPNKFGFVSNAGSGDWSACAAFANVHRFITRKHYLVGRAAVDVHHPWQEGNVLMQQYAGASWSGTPLWGPARNAWIKVNVP